MIDPLVCLATAIYFEARGEPIIGQIAVANVIINRVYDERYPDDICSVVTQGPTYTWKPDYPIRDKCQFSFFCDGKSDYAPKGNAWDTSVMVAYGVMSMRTYDVTEGATHYHATYVYPDWAESKQKTVQINNHVFYRWNYGK